tara:strand:- start:22 stop:213 length:192 start_codon:yes stop_codon:yes gene_type:complete
MFIGTCINEFPLSTSEEMTQTSNGDTIEYVISIDQEVLKNIFVKQESPNTVYINTEELYTISR